MTPFKPCYGTPIRFRRQYSFIVTPPFFEFISRMQSKSNFFINLDPRSIQNLKNRPHKTLLWAAKTQTRPLRLQRQLWFWRIHQSHRCFRAFARTLLQATLVCDPCRFIGFYRLDRAWAPTNKQRFFQLFLFPSMPPPTVPIGRVHGPFGPSRFIGIYRICSQGANLVKSGSPWGPPR